MTRKTTLGVVHFAPGEDGIAKEDDKAIQVNHVCFDGIMSDADEKMVTGLSRVTRWRMERKGKYPARVQLSPGRVGRIGAEIKAWLESRPRVNFAECDVENETV